ncbi:MAG: hypothetical protein PHW46_05655, partial [Candidatus Omnitrophica bacterium]|nr:hypothetical protein [Candidatus Omnitrophota bacterium]
MERSDRITATIADSKDRLNREIENSQNIVDKDDTIPGITEWKNRHKLLLKIVSVVLSVVFLNDQVGWSQDGKPVWAEARPYVAQYPTKFNTPDINIPYDLAEKEEAVINGGDEVVINIQDAHSSLAAQYSIVNLLDSLVTNYDLSFIALEGSSGKIDTSLLKTFPHKEIRENTARYLMREGLMSAGEFFTITRDEKEVTLFGVDNEALYQANLESFRAVAAERVERVENIDKLLSQMDSLEQIICSEPLRELNASARNHREGKLSFTDYWKIINKFAAGKGDFSDYKEIQKLLESIEIEKTIDFDKANLERRNLIDELSGKLDKAGLEALVLKSVAFKQNKISQADFHNYLVALAEKQNIDPANYPNLIKFTRYVTVYNSIELFQLYHEVEFFEDKVRGNLYQNNDEKALYDLRKMVSMLRRLYSMELTNNDSAYIEENYKKFNAKECAALIKEMCVKYKVPISSGYELDKVFGDVEPALRFYRDAEKRNNAILENTINEMRKEGKHVAALITGGYHTEGLTDLMKQNKLSYMVVLPKFEGEKERPY